MVSLIISRRLNGLAEGVSSIFHNAVRQQWSSITAGSSIGEFKSRYIRGSDVARIFIQLILLEI